MSVTEKTPLQVGVAPFSFSEDARWWWRVVERSREMQAANDLVKGALGESLAKVVGFGTPATVISSLDLFRHGPGCTCPLNR